ncbi:MqnA/MqnD/SBP family protein [Vampirovibrio sp.]|uniref:MqnA/MqnD/SBP family protein n=1 Tax=Vampirovibrio sp. TaxID=2717857 RepID=UPI0035945427
MSDIKPAPAVIRVAHSPDSDDAFMFWALAHHKIDAEGLTFEHILTDIETLNKEALKGTYELTAISYHAYAHIHEKYAILNVGSSVGDKYGPVLIAKKPLSKDELKQVTVAVPGEMTTAYLALKIWDPEIKTEVVPFDQIMERVESGEFAAGLIIHEGQLTYREQGFVKIVDLGEWWFEECNLTLPLGGNAIRRDLGPDMIQKIGRVLKRSIEHGLQNREEALDYAMQFARGLDKSTANEFVGMYVNDMTLDADEEIRKAVKLLLWRGQAIGVIQDKIEPDFIDVLPELAGSV